MSKYYRVWTQGQWDWLANKLGLVPTNYSFIFPAIFGVDNEEKLKINRIYYGVNKNELIEVSDLMEESKMEDYVMIHSEDLFQIEDQDGEGIVQVDGKGEFSIPYMPIDEISIPKSLLYPKVPMSVAEKKEFDELKNYSPLLSVAITRVDTAGGKYQHLYSKFFNHETTKEDVNVQNDFARAWADESLIEVIPEKKWNVRVPKTDDYIYFKKTTTEVKPTLTQYKNDIECQFTTEEIKQYGLDNDLFEKVEVKE